MKTKENFRRSSENNIQCSMNHEVDLREIFYCFITSDKTFIYSQYFFSNRESTFWGLFYIWKNIELANTI